MELHELPTHGAGPNGGMKIFALIPLAMDDIVQVPKTRMRKAGGEGGGSFAFRGIDDALNFVSPVMVKHGITPSVQLLQVSHSSCNVIDKYDKQKVMNRSELVLAVTFFADDGSWVRSICGGMATDYNDGTASNKAHAAAMKYAMFFGLMVPVERVALEDGDQDEEQGDSERAPQYVERAADAITPVTRPGDNKSEELMQVSLAAIKKAADAGDLTLLKNMQQRARNNAKFSDEQRNTIVKTINEYVRTIVAKKPPANQPAGTQNKPAATKPPATPASKAAPGTTQGAK